MVDEKTATVDIDALGESDLNKVEIDDETGAVSLSEPSPKDSDEKLTKDSAGKEKSEADKKSQEEEKLPEKDEKKSDDGKETSDSEVKKTEDGEKAEEDESKTEEKSKDEETTPEQKADKMVNDAQKRMHSEMRKRQEAERKLDAIEYEEKAKQLERLDESGLNEEALEELKTEDPDGYIALKQKQKPERAKVEQEQQELQDNMQTREVCSFLLQTTGVDIQAISKADGVEEANAKLTEITRNSEDFIKAWNHVRDSGIYAPNKLDVYESETLMAAHNHVFRDRILKEKVEQAQEQARKDAFAAHENAGNSGSRLSRGGPSIPGDHGERKKAKDYSSEQIAGMGEKEFAIYEQLVKDEGLD